MGPKGEPDTEMNWSTDRRLRDEPTNQPTIILFTDRKQIAENSPHNMAMYP
jgi:hypothetical protein